MRVESFVNPILLHTGFRVVFGFLQPGRTILLEVVDNRLVVRGQEIKRWCSEKEENLEWTIPAHVALNWCSNPQKGQCELAGICAYNQSFGFDGQRQEDLFGQQGKPLTKDIVWLPAWEAALLKRERVLGHRTEVGRQQANDHLVVCQTHHLTYSGHLASWYPGGLWSSQVHEGAGPLTIAGLVVDFLSHMFQGRKFQGF
mmetsp:Transcript_31206/g.67148  ORF Transcript_31206/g.67148 Transcript_31206/m.67148 type:complete len:200 (+) Transcript_31206:482-1081(+)